MTGNAEYDGGMNENRLGSVWIWNGRPDWNQIFDQNANTPYVTTGIGVAFCGTPFIGKDLACFILYTIGDLMRIPFALWGNQTEQVPALAAAALVTIFPTIPALVYLTFFQPKRFPFETIGGCVQFAFILFEFPLLWRSLQYNADVQHARFVRLTLQPEHED